MCKEISRSATEVPPTPEAPYLGREFVKRAVCEQASPVLDAAVLLASEAITNAVVHGVPPIVLEVDCSEKATEIRVQDGSSSRPMRREPEMLGTSGRGMMLIDTLADNWGVRPTHAGKEVWFRLSS